MTDFTKVGQSFLSHYGVKGMKWGVRKDRGPSRSQLIKTDRKAARKELEDREVEWDAARARYKLAKKTGNKVAIKNAREELKKADDAWAETYRRTEQKTTGESIASVVVPAAAIVTPFLIAAGSRKVSGILTAQNAAKKAAGEAAVRAATHGIGAHKTVPLIRNIDGVWRVISG